MVDILCIIIFSVLLPHDFKDFILSLLPWFLLHIWVKSAHPLFSLYTLPCFALPVADKKYEEWIAKNHSQKNKKIKTLTWLWYLMAIQMFSMSFTKMIFKKSPVLEKVGVNRHFTLFFSWFPVLSLFSTRCLTAKIASTSNLRKNAFSLMNYVWPWMRTKVSECFICFVFVCVWQSDLVYDQKYFRFALSVNDACTAWDLCCCWWKCIGNIVTIRDYLKYTHFLVLVL